jgi:3-hydroxybutyryl-CoA dehydrogenase
MKVTVVGAGIMGSGIAQLAAMAGDEVVNHDVSTDQHGRAQAAVAKSLARFAKKGTISEADATGIAERISYTTDLPAAVAGAEVVIEAAPEILDVKREIFTTVVDHAPDDALLGTNTSQLSITSIAAPLGDHARRLIGLHFFNPPVMMRLLEVIAGLQTDEATIERARALGDHLGREVVVCRKDSPGFLTSRAYAILRLECVKMLEEGLASAEDIDKALRLGFNFPMGPLELGDMNGIDTYLHALDGLAGAHGDRFRPTVGLKNMVAANRLGRKSGHGFYDYDADGRRITETDS